MQRELAKWLTREVGEDKADQVAAFTQPCQVVLLDTAIALAAAQAARAHRLPTADAIVCATARARGARLLTCDPHFTDLPGVALVAKPGARGSGLPRTQFVPKCSCLILVFPH